MTAFFPKSSKAMSGFFMSEVGLPAKVLPALDIENSNRLPVEATIKGGAAIKEDGFFISADGKPVAVKSVERMNYNGGNNALAVTSSITRFIAAHGLHFVNRLTEVS